MAVHMYTFCAKDSIFFLFRRANLFLPARRYAKNYKMPIEEKKAYLEFKRELREHRKKYMNESLELVSHCRLYILWVWSNLIETLTDPSSLSEGAGHETSFPP